MESKRSKCQDSGAGMGAEALRPATGSEGMVSSRGPAGAFAWSLPAARWP